MPSIATVTGTVGPGLTAAATVFNNVVRLDLDTVSEVLTIYMSDKPPAYVNIGAQTTLLLTVVAPNNYTLTVT